MVATMIKQLRLGFFSCLLLCASGASWAEKDDLQDLQTKLGNQWVTVKNDRLHNMVTYAKQEDGKRFRSFKVEAVFDGTVESLTRMVLDFERYDRWSWNVLKSQLLKKVSATEYYIYVVHDAPYGVPDRDIILHVVFEPATAKGSGVVMRFNAVPDYLPEKPPLVRMQAEDMTARFVPLPDNKVQVTNEGYVDPGGNMASWAINFVQRNAPYITLLGMRRMMQNSDYTSDKTPLPFAISGQP